MPINNYLTENALIYLIIQGILMHVAYAIFIAFAVYSYYRKNYKSKKEKENLTKTFDQNDDTVCDANCNLDHDPKRNCRSFKQSFDRMNYVNHSMIGRNVAKFKSKFKSQPYINQNNDSSQNEMEEDRKSSDKISVTKNGPVSEQQKREYHQDFLRGKRHTHKN